MSSKEELDLTKDITSSIGGQWDSDGMMTSSIGMEKW